MFALRVRQKQPQGLTNFVVGTFLAAADIDEAEKWLRKAESSAKGDDLVRVHYNAASLEFRSQSLEVENDLNYNVPIVYVGVRTSAFKVTLYFSME